MKGRSSSNDSNTAPSTTKPIGGGPMDIDHATVTVGAVELDNGPKALLNPSITIMGNWKKDAAPDKTTKSTNSQEHKTLDEPSSSKSPTYVIMNSSRSSEARVKLAKHFSEFEGTCEEFYKKIEREKTFFFVKRDVLMDFSDENDKKRIVNLLRADRTFHRSREVENSDEMASNKKLSLASISNKKNKNKKKPVVIHVGSWSRGSDAERLKLAKQFSKFGGSPNDFFQKLDRERHFVFKNRDGSLLNLSSSSSGPDRQRIIQMIRNTFSASFSTDNRTLNGSEQPQNPIHRRGDGLANSCPSKSSIPTTDASEQQQQNPIHQSEFGFSTSSSSESRTNDALEQQQQHSIIRQNDYAFLEDDMDEMFQAMHAEEKRREREGLYPGTKGASVWNLDISHDPTQAAFLSMVTPPSPPDKTVVLCLFFDASTYMLMKKVPFLISRVHSFTKKPLDGNYVETKKRGIMREPQLSMVPSSWTTCPAKRAK
eukprot:scaffold2004_cov101-Cylindrotheca_fusiformis.AAC.12